MLHVKGLAVKLLLNLRLLIIRKTVAVNQKLVLLSLIERRLVSDVELMCWLILFTINFTVGSLAMLLLVVLIVKASN